MAGLKPVFLLFGTMVLPVVVSAQTDSAQTRLREVEVTTSRVSRFAIGSRMAEATPRQIKLKQHAPLTELLRLIAPVYLKNYGAGNLASLSLRGTTANQAALVWNGLQINAPTNGITDLNLIQTGTVQAVQLVQGPMSALYGSGAVGGTLFLNSAPVPDSAHALQISQTAGSFSTYHTRVGGTYGGTKWQGRSSYSYASSRNNFWFANPYLPGSPEQRTTHARFFQHNFTQDLYFFPGKGYSVELHGWHYATQRQIPPVLGVPQSRATQSDKALRLAAVLRRQAGRSLTTFRSGYLTDYLLYQNPQLYATTPKPARTTTWVTEAEQQFTFRTLTLNAGLSLRNTAGKVTEYGGPVKQHQQAVFLSARQQFASGTAITLSARKEFVPGYDPDPTASAGAEQVLGRFKQVKLKAQVANSFRVPTLNERFWRPGGNPDLKPEKGLSAEAGIAFSGPSQTSWLQHLEITGYTSEISDLILWRQVSAIVYSPQNVSRVWARGAEVSVGVQKHLLPGDRLQLNLRGGYAFTRSTQRGQEAGILLGKQLPYIPEHSGFVFTGIKTQVLNVGWQQNFQGPVFTTSDNLETLPGFSLADLLVWSPEVELSKIRMELQAAVRNIFHKQYQVIRNTPMPGRQYELSIHFSFPYAQKLHAQP